MSPSSLAARNHLSDIIFRLQGSSCPSKFSALLSYLTSLVLPPIYSSFLDLKLCGGCDVDVDHDLCVPVCVIINISTYFPRIQLFWIKQVFWFCLVLLTSKSNTLSIVKMLSKSWIFYVLNIWYSNLEVYKDVSVMFHF